MCPSLDRGVCNVPSLSCAKEYAQLVPMLISSASLCSASPSELWQDWCGCVHTATRPNTLSPLSVLSGTIRRNAISCLGFSMLPHAPAWKRAHSTESIISLNQNCERGDRDHVTTILPGLMAPIGQHPWRSACSHSFLLLKLKTFSQLEGVSAQMPGGDASCDDHMSCPATLVAHQWKVPRCRLSSKGWFNFNAPLCSRNDITEVKC